MIDKKKYIIEALVSMLSFYFIVTPVAALIISFMDILTFEKSLALMFTYSLFYMNGLWLGYSHACRSVVNGGSE